MYHSSFSLRRNKNLRYVALGVILSFLSIASIIFFHYNIGLNTIGHPETLPSWLESRDKKSQPFDRRRRKTNYPRNVSMFRGGEEHFTFQNHYQYKQMDSEEYEDGAPDAFDEDGCVGMKKWQYTSYPTCNDVHVYDWASGEDGLRFLADGYWRDTWSAYSRDVSSPDRKVVLKTIRFQHGWTGRNFERHRRDALAMERLTFSKHVLNIYAFCGNSGAFEFGAGGDVYRRTYKERNKMLSPLDKLQMSYEVASGIADAHSFDGDRPTLAHTDIKGDQFIFVDGVLKLNDFNRCRFLRWNNTSNEECGYYVGRNPKTWRSPEEYRYDKQSEKVDVYSMGNVLYVILTGMKPFYQLRDVSTDKEIQKAIIRGRRPHIPDIFLNSGDESTDAVVRAIKKCWIDPPNSRATAVEIRDGLFKALNEYQSKN